MYKHQEFALRAMKMMKEVVIIDETGTGKTCTVSSFTEYAHAVQKTLKEDEFN